MSYHEIEDTPNNRTFHVGVAEHSSGHYWGMKDEISDPHKSEGHGFGPYKTHKQAHSAAKEYLTGSMDPNKRGSAARFAFK